MEEMQRLKIEGARNAHAGTREVLQHEEGNSVWLVAMEEKLVAAARNPTNVKGEQKE